MADFIVDTNVLLLACAKDPASPFKDSNAPAEQMQIALDWLKAFREDRNSNVVLDQCFRIWNEYHNKMIRGRDIGSLVLMEKLDRSLARFIEITYDEHGHACLPRALEKVVHDQSDRKFVAVALVDLAKGGKSTIVNAVDTDWCDWEKALKRHGIAVLHLVDGLCGNRLRTKAKR